MKILDEFLNLFNQSGYEAYGIGGCVRDHLLGLRVNDFDVTTNATPEEMMSLFNNYPLNKVGCKFGTIGVLYQGHWFECTTFRTEQDYQNHRYPSRVMFGQSLMEDVRRRDFTINGLAYHEGQIIDYVYGREDINKGLIRCIGNPNERFIEDALRICRALRFSSKLGFKIEAQTYQAMKVNKHLLDTVSKERKTIEFKGIILGKYVNTLIDDINHFYTLELKDIDVSLDTFETRLVSGLNEPLDLNQFSLSSYSKRLIEFLTRFKTLFIDTSLLRKLMSQFNEVFIIELVKLRKMEDLYQTILNDHENIYKLEQLAINGHDLIEWNIEPIQRTKVLHYLFDLVINKKVKNNKKELFQALKDTNDFR